MDEEGRPSLEGNDESSDGDTSDSGTELMVTSRARRATAGNRYSTLVAQEEAIEDDDEDEVAMLFAEGEGEDDDFNSDEGEEDADMSSSDDDDQGPNVALEDLEGEKEIQKEAKEERAKKRKADMALTTMAGLKKKPKIDPTALRRAPVPKPSKRKERVSWLPESDAAPGRTSLRKQTILHRAETHAKLKENEEQRLKLKARREKREREKEAEAPKEMTQADRLAEAERVERRNAKSLNRWEAMERRRAEEQAAKLAALKNRKLEGAVVTWHSSSAKYIGLKEKEPEGQIPPEGKKRGRKPKALLEQLAAAKLASQEEAASSTSTSQAASVMQTQDNETPPSAIPTTDNPLLTTSVVSSRTGAASPTTTKSANQEAATQPTPQSKEPNRNEDAFLTGIHEYASMQPSTKLKEVENSKEGPATIHVEAPSPSMELSNDMDIDTSLSPARVPSIETANNQKISEIDEKSVTTQSGIQSELQPNIASSIDIHDKKEAASNTDSVDKAQATSGLPKSDVDNAGPGSEPINIPAKEQEMTDQPQPSVDDGHIDLATTEKMQPDLRTASADLESQTAATPPAEPPVEVVSTRNLVILEKFDDLPENAKRTFGLFYNKKTTTKPVKHNPELCPITGLTARYRDPATGIGYANATAYKKLQELKTHQFVWSGMLGCYVGRTSLAARGVPEGFLSA